QDSAMGQNFAAMGEEILDEIVLLRSEVYGLSAHLNQALLRIDLEVARFIGHVRLGRGGGAAQQGANTRGEFSHAKRLGNIIVRAEIECLDLGGLVFLD